MGQIKDTRNKGGVKKTGVGVIDSGEKGRVKDTGNKEGVIDSGEKGRVKDTVEVVGGDRFLGEEGSEWYWGGGGSGS